MAPFDTTRRLCLLFEAGKSKFAIDAACVMEVATPDADGRSIRGSLELKDLSQVFGEGPEEFPGMGLVLDISPTLAARIKRVVEVADVSTSPVYVIPPNLSKIGGLLRGAIQHREAIYLELAIEALQEDLTLGEVARRPVNFCREAPDRALVFESQGALFGVALPFVLQVLSGGAGALAGIPSPAKAVIGLLTHSQTLWPVYCAPSLLGRPERKEDFVVLTELAGQHVGLSASRVLGVYRDLARTEQQGEFSGAGLPSPVLFLDLQGMFS